MDLWQRKLLAFLHDPPCKALDIAGHEERRETFVRQAGFTEPEDMEWYEKNADRMAAAYDRYDFPEFKSSGLTSRFGGEDHPFRHPLGLTSLAIPEPPTPDIVGGKLQTIQHYAQNLPSDAQGEERDRINFFLHWRRWPVDGAQSEWRSACMPADTRIPDHTIWNHNSITSAIQCCWNAENNAIEPAFLLFQAGPVQEFIAQARSTRDLWSGSYMLSWLMAHAIKAVTDATGPDAVIFPFLRAQPLFDLLHRDLIYARVPYTGPGNREDSLWTRMKTHEREMLTPNLPNRFLALVPAGRAEELARAADKAFCDELKEIGKACWLWFEQNGHSLKDEWRPRFDAQIEVFPQVAWQTYPWKPETKDTWRDACKQTDRLLAARRNTRNFVAWPTDSDLAGARKDSLSGKEEIVGGEDWWKALRQNDKLKRLFRSDDVLGAVNLVKRVWHEAYLRDVWKLDVKKAVSFESVPDVAAGAWLADVREKRLNVSLRQDQRAFDAILRVGERIADHASEWGLPELDQPTDQTLDKWLDHVPPGAFMPASWKGRRGEECKPVIEALGALYRRVEGRKDPILDKPPGYVAIIAMDGDKMGEWMSGEKMPLLMEQFSKEAQQYFQDKPEKSQKRPLYPSFHAQFSEALANFAVYLARPVVKHFGGQLIYAGGDDVVCMTPAAVALDCAEALRAAFRGQTRLTELVPGIFEVFGDKGGWVKLAKPKGEQP